MEQTALARREDAGLSEVIQVGRMIAKSGYFTDAREEAQAVVKVLAGQELGIGPVAAMQGIYIVKGRVTLGANLMAALIKASGRYNYRVIELTDKVARIAFFEEGKPVGESAFSMDDAKKAGLSGANWTGYPRNMLFARALSNGAKWYCPDAFSGTTPYTRDEIENDGGIEELPTVDVKTGEVIEAEVAAEPEPAAPPADDKRRKVIEAIFGDWDERQELDAAFSTWKRRKNSIIGQMKAAWPAIETADMNDEEAVLHWLETADLEQVRTYGKHNRARLAAEREAAELAEEEPGDGDAG